MLMDKRGQELNPVGILMGVIGFFLAFYMSGTMGSQFVGKLIVGGITGVAMYFLSSKIMNA